MPALKNTFASVKSYLHTWQQDMDRIFSGKTTNVPTPFNRENFFLDDSLPFKPVTYFECMQEDFILTVIGPSRILSLSLFIEPIYLLRKRLLFDQRLELCFAASFLSNPFWFDHVLRLLIGRDNDPQDSFQFALHPFFDWVQTTQEIFGGQWQGGPHNRWSPCGGGKPVTELFGATQDCSKEQRRVGQIRLEKVISILYKHVCWMNTLSGCGDKCIHDMPLDMIQRQMETTRKAIHDVVPCQFSLFRLSIFTTLIIGCGEATPGRHLRQFMFPIKNTASYEHLKNTSLGQISKEQATELCRNINLATTLNNGNTQINPDSHDLAMLYLSAYLNLPVYNRDEMECVLCESIPGRKLSCRDWFRKGQRLFDINNNGQPLMKEYGQDSRWQPIQVYDKLCNCAYLTPYVVFIPRNNEIIQLARQTGKTIRESSQIIFEGRGTKTSTGSQQYTNNYCDSPTAFPSKLEYRVANFYFNARAGKHEATSRMRVLGDSVPAKYLLTEANCLDDCPIGISLVDKVTTLLTTTFPPSAGKEPAAQNFSKHPMNAACYHQELTTPSMSHVVSNVLYFPGHRDKSFVYRAIFVPLTDRMFYTFIAVPVDWKLYQDTESRQSYVKWKSGLNDIDRTKLTNFETSFLKEATRHMKIAVEMHLFQNQIGSVLSFPANFCYHATVTPANYMSSEQTVGRDLLIIHPLDLTM